MTRPWLKISCISVSGAWRWFVFDKAKIDRRLWGDPCAAWLGKLFEADTVEDCYRWLEQQEASQ